MDEQTFRHVLEIARIKLTEDEFKSFLSQFDEIFELLRRVKDVSFGGEEEPTVKNPLREDEVVPFDSDPTIVFPRKKNGYLEVPRNL